MRISDWSSDVCSSDLLGRHPHIVPQLAGVAQPIARGQVQIADLGIGVGEDDPGLVRIGETRPIPALHQFAPRLLARIGLIDHAMPPIGMDRLAGSAPPPCLRFVALPVPMLPAYVEGTSYLLGKIVSSGLDLCGCSCIKKKHSRT